MEEITPDSQNKTGEKIIKKLNKKALLELYTSEDIVEDYQELRRRIGDTFGTDNKEFVSLIGLLWRHTFGIPKQTELELENKDDEISEVTFQTVVGYLDENKNFVACGRKEDKDDVTKLRDELIRTKAELNKLKPVKT